MPRSTEETLKQIQKQGLSISIVSTENSRSSYALDSSGSKEVKTKQSASIDKTPKPTTRSLVVTENKPTLVQSKPIPITTSELRSYTGQTIFSSNQSSPVESKMQSGNKKGTIFPPALETRAFGSQSWSNPSTLTTEKKGSGGFNRIGQPDNKSSGRVSQNSTAFSESKTPNVRANQNILQLTDGKSQNRNNQSTSISECKVPVSSCSQSQLSFEGKLTGNQGRNTPSSPPLEKKILNSTQVRSSQNFSAVHENKNSASQRTANQLLNNNQVKVIQNKSADMKTPNQIRVQQSPNLRSVKHISIEKVQTTVKSVNEQPSVDSPVSERSMNNPFRVASTTLGKKVSNSEEKSSVKLVSQSVVSALSENNSSALSKISQNLSVHVENKANSQAVKVSSVSSESSQKPSVSSDHSPSSPMSPPTTIAPGKRIVGIKRSQPVRIVTQNSPVAAKKKCIKRAPPGVPSNSNRLQTNSRTNVDPSNSNSEENTPKEKFFKMNLTPGLTITPVNANLKGGPNSRPNAPKGPIPSTSAVTHCPSCNEISVNLNFCDSCNAKIPANSQQISVSADSFVYTKKTTSIHKKVYSFQFQKSVNKIMVETNPLMQVSPRSKGRPRTRRKFVEPVCYTLSSDDDDEEPAPYHPIFPQPQLFPVDSEGSKSEHSSTSEILQEENQEFDDQQFPGVTEINEQIEIEEPDEEEMMDYECEEEEEIDESIEEEEEEDEEIAAEDPEPDVVPGQKPTDYPLRCRSIRIGLIKYIQDLIVYTYRCLWQWIV
ncbi:uncharacterized protein CDAR_82441 [Caerostris darwini]|uniref:Uncharacterized protein n=1 Tax=Caerostris darwini TaxID=1538125 RepID=A0AAV4V2T8_9ARAC|nr:uncharacterized protein CDAR_82441 [Caerostris darwini]